MGEFGEGTSGGGFGSAFGFALGAVQDDKEKKLRDEVPLDGGEVGGDDA